MMRALRPEIQDPLFEMIKDRLPEPPVHPNGGCRKRISDKLCFKGLFWRFITGAAWETVEHQLDHQVSDTTLRSRRDEWVAAGIFDELMLHVLAEYERLIGVETDNIIIDGSSQLAPGGGPDTGKYVGSKGRLGFKWSLGVDSNGIGVGVVVATGERNDYRLLEPTLDDIFERDFITEIGTLHLDRGYGYPSVHDKLEPYAIDQVEVPMRKLPNQGRVELVGFNQRWVVERTNGWLTNFRQLKINWDRKIEHRHAAMCLALTVLCLYRLVDHLKANNLPPDTIR